MKKYLMIAAATAAIVSADAGAFGTGFYAGTTVGYSYNTTKLATKDATKDMNTKIAGVAATMLGDFKKANNSAFNATLFAGYDKMFCENFFYDVRFFGSYDTANGKVFDVTAVNANPKTGGSASATYRPQFGLGLGAYVGRTINDTIAGYVGLSGELNFAKLKTSGTVTAAGAQVLKSTDSIRTISLAPTIGLKGQLNDKMGWLAEVSYKFAISTSGFNKDTNMNFAKKPKAVVAKIGVSYHF